MKRFSGVLLPVLALLLLPCYVAAQGQDPPPTCCPRDGSGILLPDPDLALAPDAETSGVITVSVSKSALASMGMTRNDFVDRISALLFPGQAPDMLIPTTSVVAPDLSFDEGSRRTYDAGGTPVSVRVRRLYMFPSSAVPKERIEGLDQLFLTDWRTYLQINFGPDR